MFEAKVYITLKEGILDTQGVAVQSALVNLDYNNVESLRVGKLITLKVNEANKSQAESQIKEMCEKLLTNPIIENYSFELSECN